MRAPRVWTADRVQAMLNLVGAGTFVVGSVLFLGPQVARIGVVCFIVGSVAMLAAALVGWRERWGGELPVASGRSASGEGRVVTTGPVRVRAHPNTAAALAGGPFSDGAVAAGDEGWPGASAGWGEPGAGEPSLSAGASLDPLPHRRPPHRRRHRSSP